VAAPPDDVERSNRRVGVPTWITLGAGVALVGGGAVFGLLSGSAHDDYLATRIETANDADRALGHFSRAEDQALVANVLFVSGVITLGVAAVLLALDLDLFAAMGAP
jgi:hypothetical protein